MKPHRFRPKFYTTLHPDVIDRAKKHVKGSSDYRSVSHLIECLLTRHLDEAPGQLLMRAPNGTNIGGIPLPKDEVTT